MALFLQFKDTKKDREHQVVYCKFATNLFYVSANVSEETRLRKKIKMTMAEGFM